MAKKKNAHVDRAQAKAAKQKKLAIGLSAVLVIVMVFEVPKTMKMMHPKAKAPVVTASASTPPAATPTAGATSPPVAAPTPAPSAAAALVSSVQVAPQAGQLSSFSEFASKDPFDESVQKTPGGDGSAPAPAKPSKLPATPKAPPAPPPTSAVISVNGALMSVGVGAQFPQTATATSPAGSPLFQLDALTVKTAKVSIVGGSYADGAPSLTLTVGKAVTLQNTADGSRYTLLLEPPGTPIPATTTTAGGAASTAPALPLPGTTTPSVVPSGGGG